MQSEMHTMVELIYKSQKFSRTIEMSHIYVYPLFTSERQDIKTAIIISK